MLCFPAYRIVTLPYYNMVQSRCNLGRKLSLYFATIDYVSTERYLKPSLQVSQKSLGNLKGIITQDVGDPCAKRGRYLYLFRPSHPEGLHLGDDGHDHIQRHLQFCSQFHAGAFLHQGPPQHRQVRP